MSKNETKETVSAQSYPTFIFNRVEFSGALGDLGTLLPIAIANSQGIANIISFALGGIPMCHGAGGLAAMYRFGARTAAANLMIGGIFVALAILFGQNALPILTLLHD